MTAAVLQNLSDAHTAPLQHATRFRVGRPRVPAHAGPGGSPFQMPTRLADGLGPESDLDDGSPSTFAPPGFLRFGSPALACRKAGRLRLLRDECAPWEDKCQTGD